MNMHGGDPNVNERTVYRAQVSSVGVCWYENRGRSRACPPWWVERQVSESPPVNSIPISISIRHPTATVSRWHHQPRKRGFASASSAPKGRHPSAQGSALGTRHTPDSQPRRGAIAGRAVPMDCRYAAPAGLHLVLDSIPRALPWAEEWPRFQRSAASGIRDTSRRKSPSRVT